MGLDEYEAVVILIPGIDVKIFRDKVLNMEGIYYFKEWDDIGFKPLVCPIKDYYKGHYIKFVFATLSGINNVENSLKMYNEVLKFIIVRCE